MEHYTLIIDLKNKIIALIIILLKTFFHPFLSLHESTKTLLNNPEKRLLSLINCFFILAATLANIIYFLVNSIEKSLFNQLLTNLNIFPATISNIIAFSLNLICAANIGNYFGNAINKIYCYIKFGDPNLYFTDRQLEKIAINLNKKGYTYVNQEILLEIIKFCIKNANHNKLDLLGSKAIDWKYSIEHLLNSDLELFLSQQQTLKIKRKEIIHQIVTFYIYHQRQHQKNTAVNLPKESTPLLANLTCTPNSIDQKKTFHSNPDSTYFNVEYPELTESFNNRFILFDVEKNFSIQNEYTQNEYTQEELPPKEYCIFKEIYLEKNKIKPSAYTEYMLLDEYERHLYAKAEAISENIFPDEIIRKITYNQISHNTSTLMDSRRGSIENQSALPQAARHFPTSSTQDLLKYSFNRNPIPLQNLSYSLCPSDEKTDENSGIISRKKLRVSLG